MDTCEPPDGRAGIDATLVRRLLAEQLPHLAHLPVEPVPVDGHDNRTYRLGEHLSVRLPTADGYAVAVAKEDTWLPRLAPHLPLPVPVPVALGEPSAPFPRPWSVRRWLPGATVATTPVDLVSLAVDLADFLVALRAAPATGGPPAGEHSFHRGGSLTAYDAATRGADRQLGTDALPVWEEALASEWAREPVWFHGDVAVGNLLVASGRLCGVIDFGTCGVGDPACDLVIAWTHLDDAARAAFCDRVGLDTGTWARARGWALWKALVTVARPGGDPVERGRQERALAQLLASRRR